MIGKNISNYYITEQLGEGGMGTVYKATDKYLERTVALKMLHPFLVKDPDYFKRFRNEAHLSAKISHPNVATLYNFEESGQQHFIVMEYVDGLPLDKVLKLQGKLSEKEAARITLQILEGLGAAHDLGIMHRDLKPGNIMINQSGYVKLMDFGIARLENAERMTQQNSVIGTLEYLAPELVKGQTPSKSSDLYALGVMLHEMLSGNTLFQADSEAALMYQIAHTSPKIHLPETDPRLVRILKKLTYKQVQKRYQDTREVIRDLEKLYVPGKVDTRLLEEKVDSGEQSGKKVWAMPMALPQKLSSIILPDARRINMPFDIDIRIIAAAAGISLLILIIGLIPAGNQKNTQEDPNSEFKNLYDIDDEKMQAVPSIGQQDMAQRKPIKAIPFKEGEGPGQPGRQKTPKEQEQEYVNRPKQHVIKPVDGSSSTEKSRSDARKEESSSTDRQQQQTDQEPEEEENLSRNEQESFNVEQEQVVKRERSPGNTMTLSIPQMEFNAVFLETISTESNHEGEMIFLSNKSPLYYGDHVIIAGGAKIRAQIVKLRRSSGFKRAFLGINLISVQAVNGQWLPVSYPEYSNLGKNVVVFEQGRTLRNVKIEETMLTISIP